MDGPHASGRIIVIAINPAQYRVILATFFFDLLDDFTAELDSSLHSPIFILSCIEGRGEKSAQEVTMGTMDLYGIKACFFSSQCCLTKLPDDFFTLIKSQRTRWIKKHLGARCSRAGDRLRATDSDTGLPSRMHDLKDYLCSMTMDLFGQLF